MVFTKSKRKGNLTHERILGNINFFWHIHYAVLLRSWHGSETENQTSDDEPDAACNHFYRCIPASFRDRIPGIQQQRKIYQLSDDSGYRLPGGSAVPAAGYAEEEF